MCINIEFEYCKGFILIYFKLIFFYFMLKGFVWFFNFFFYVNIIKLFVIIWFILVK